jgi:glycosyltransferase involved in cell wall biosynthesis
VQIAALTPYVPYAGIAHAGGLYLHHYVAAVTAAGHRVTLVAPDDADNRAAAPLRPAGTDLVLVPMPPVPDGLRRRAWNLRNFRQGLTPGWQFLRAFRRDPRVRAAVAAADLVELHWGYLLPLAPDVRRWAPGAPLVCFGHDVVGQALARRAVTERDPVRRWKARLLAGRVARQEAAYLGACDHACYFSPNDVALLRSHGVETPLSVVAPYLDLPVSASGPAADPVVLFVAAFHRPDNVEAARWLLDEVWPRVTVPGARLVLAGAAPPPSVVARAGGAVTVTGYVPDLDPLYRAARVVVAPLRSGAGLKFKVPQAMAYGLPVVATSVAAEGIVEESGPEVFGAVTDDAAAFATAVSALLTGDAVAVGTRARAWVTGRYDFAASVRDVLAVYAGLV